MSQILIVDDDARIRTALAEAMESETVEVRTAETGEAALAALTSRPFDVMLADVRMPGMGGLELLKASKEMSPETAVILMTAYDDLPTVATAMRDGAVDVLVKPLDLFKLREILERLLAEKKIERRKVQSDPQDGLGLSSWLIGRDPSMIEVFKLIGHAARSVSNVMIRGESGTGKELIARSIHALSSRGDGPFIPVNCAAMPEPLIESEFFGHVRGAFTSAVGDRRGRFALAENGTIFLDEIGDTSPDFQAKLLRVIQEGEFCPVGSEKSYTTNARVITATHRDLEVRVSERRFREDLYYRLRVIEIQVPPLRQRKSDIPLLVKFFLDRKSRFIGRSAPNISSEGLEKLINYDWPGNVRELENCVEQALVTATESVIHPDRLILGVAPRGEAPGLLSLEEAERATIVKALEATGGQKFRAAEILGVSRPRLDRLIGKFGLEKYLRSRE